MDELIMTASERPTAREREYHHHVYVVELARDVLHEAKFVDGVREDQQRQAA
jgi:hypothetical protein